VTVTRTAPISAATTWNNQPAAQLEAGAQSFAHGYNSSCPDAYVEFPVTASMADTATKGYTSSTFRLRATNEADGIAWKQFNSVGQLEVTYVSPPAVPTGVGLKNPNVGCDDASSPVNVGSIQLKLGATPRLSAADTGARVEAEFVLYSANSGALVKTVRTGLESPGTAITFPIDSVTLADQGTYRFRARTLYPYSSTGTLASAYTGWCYFKVDRLAPPPPTVTAKYGAVSLPNCTLSGTTCDEIVPFGAAVSYTIKGAAADVIRHEYWYEGSFPHGGYTGHTITRNLVPKQEGYSLLHVVSYDSAGHASTPTDYLINIKSAAPPIAAWKFDDGTGTTAADAATPAHPLNLAGGATFDDAGRDRGSVALDGVDDYAQTATTIVDTSQSFTVSAWVRLTAQKEAVVVGAAGNIGSAFELFYSASLNRWAFLRMKTDTMTPAIVMAKSDDPAVLGAWTHITGVYDSGLERIQLYVNGRLQVSGDIAFPDSAWKATGPLSVGQGQYNDSYTNRFAGSIDRVQIWQRGLNDDAVMALTDLRENDQLVASQAARWPLEGATLGADQLWRTEDAVYGANMTIAGFGSTADQSTAFVEDDERGRVLEFSGATSEALSIPRTTVDAATSFSVGIWVKLADPTKPVVIARQAGADRDAWRLEWRPLDALSGQWIFSRTPTNSTTEDFAIHTDDIDDQFASEWHLVIGTYDASSPDVTNQGQLGGIDITVNKLLSDGGKARHTKPYRLGSTVVGKGRVAGSGFVGRLADFRLYVGRLADAAICDEYPELAAGVCPRPAG
jgi:hypothetical protein